ncbi:MAG: hypothetical protein JSR64_15840 [Nitrospira sp.]|nr:hypothetical protein [Nitrospira sp.]
MSLVPPFESRLSLDELPIQDLAATGRLYLLSAPGRVLEGWPRDGQASRDLLWLKTSHGIQGLVSLLEDLEIDQLDGISLGLEASGVECTRLPVRDGLIPLDTIPYGCAVIWTAGQVSSGRVVGIHCREGLGRTGTFAAAVLQVLGVTAHESIKRVRAARTGTISNELQEAFVLQMPLVLEEAMTPTKEEETKMPGPKPIIEMTEFELRQELSLARILIADLTKRMNETIR